jgi:hypothetical protein
VCNAIDYTTTVKQTCVTVYVLYNSSSFELAMKVAVHADLVIVWRLCAAAAVIVLEAQLTAAN